MIPSDRMAGAITKLKKKMANMKKVKTNQRRQDKIKIKCSLFYFQPVVSVLSLEGSIAAGKSRGSLSLEQCRKRAEKAFESDRLAGVLLRQVISLNYDLNQILLVQFFQD